MAKLLPLPCVAFDEAGNTGANLLDPNQPVFVQASVLATDAISAIPRGLGELKFSKLRRSAAGPKGAARSGGHMPPFVPRNLRGAWF